MALAEAAAQSIVIAARDAERNESARAASPP